MEKFDLYIHGVPIGHQCCGCDENLDYIKSFYNSDKVKESSLLQIDVVQGKSFYTYLRKKNVKGVEGRSGSYFGLTVSFANRYCTNVYVLYKILDSIYKNKCVGSLIEQESDGERFLVREIETARCENYLAVDYIRKLFDSNISILSFDDLEEYVSSKSTIKFNLDEVDSQLFHKALKNYRILVSPEYKSARDRCESFLSETEKLKDENRNLKEEKNLSDSTNNAKKRHLRKQNDDLKTRLEEYEEENRRLKGQIKEISGTSGSFDEPVKKYTRRMAGRFQEDINNPGQIMPDIHNANGTKYLQTKWFLVGCVILLFCVLFTCMYSCSVVSKLSGVLIPQGHNGNDSTQTYNTDTSNVVGGEEVDLQSGNFDFSKCRIDVSPYGDNNPVEKGKSYQLAIVNKEDNTVANVLPGKWLSTPGIIICGCGHVLTVDSINAQNSINAQKSESIYYVVNNDTVLSKTIKVKTK